MWLREDCSATIFKTLFVTPSLNALTYDTSDRMEGAMTLTGTDRGFIPALVESYVDCTVFTIPFFFYPNV